MTLGVAQRCLVLGAACCSALGAWGAWGLAARAPRLACVASLSDPEVRDFLQQGTRTGKLSYLAASGRPLVAPVWFIVEDDSIVFNTGKDTAKGRSLARDPRVSLCVDLEEPPYAFVQVQGEAELSEDPAELLRTATAIGARYMGHDRAAEYGKRNGVPGELIVRLRPVRVIAVFDVAGLRAADQGRRSVVRAAGPWSGPRARFALHLTWFCRVSWLPGGRPHRRSASREASALCDSRVHYETPCR
jgi:PPOX class probable F420-dependent enzyme